MTLLLCSMTNPFDANLLTISILGMVKDVARKKKKNHSQIISMLPM